MRNGAACGKQVCWPPVPQVLREHSPAARGMTTDSGIWISSSEFLRTPKAGPLRHMAGTARGQIDLVGDASGRPAWIPFLKQPRVTA